MNGTRKYGTFTFKNGNKFQGYFKDNKMDRGLFYYSANEDMFDGVIRQIDGVDKPFRGIKIKGGNGGVAYLVKDGSEDHKPFTGSFTWRNTDNKRVRRENYEDGKFMWKEEGKFETQDGQHYLKNGSYTHENGNWHTMKNFDWVKGYANLPYGDKFEGTFKFDKKERRNVPDTGLYTKHCTKPECPCDGTTVDWKNGKEYFAPQFGVGRRRLEELNSTISRIIREEERAANRQA